MNTLERKVSESLRAYGEGLVMTTQDVERLEQGLEKKQDQRHAARKARRARVWQAAVAACAVTGVVLGAVALRDDPATPPASPAAVTVAELKGIWRVDHAGGPSNLWTFHADGRMTTSDGLEALLQPERDSTWTVGTAPGGFTLTADPLNGSCTMTLTGSITPEGTLSSTVSAVAGGCPIDVGYVWPLTRISPRSTAGAGLTSAYATTAAQDVTNLVPLMGTWVLRGTGTILGIYSSLDYVVLEPGAATPQLTGTVSRDPDGSIVFKPQTEPACTAVYESVTTDTSTFVAQLADGSCNRLGSTADTWVKLN